MYSEAMGLNGIASAVRLSRTADLGIFCRYYQFVEQ